MSHAEQLRFFDDVQLLFPTFFHRARVLEIGSLDINGTVRNKFADCDYVGVDLGEGAGVDVVARGEDLVYPDNSFCTVISAECFEHNQEWRRTFENAVRMCNGLVVFSAATDGRAEHGTPRTTPEDSPFTSMLSDYYENVSPSEVLKFALDEWFVAWELLVNPKSCDIYFWGLRAGQDSAIQSRNDAFAAAFQLRDTRLLATDALAARIRTHLLEDLAATNRTAELALCASRRALALLLNRERLRYLKPLRKSQSWREQTQFVATGPKPIT